MRPSYGNCITEEVTEMPRSFSIAIQSEVSWRAALRDFTEPAIWMAPPNSSSFSVSVVLPASGCEMIAKVRRRCVSRRCSDMGQGRERGRSLGECAYCNPGPEKPYFFGSGRKPREVTMRKGIETRRMPVLTCTQKCRCGPLE